jgi:hypothetical protein
MKTALVLCLLLAASPARAGQEFALLSWDGCVLPGANQVDNQEFTGPGLYAMTVSVSGSARTIQGFELQIEVMDPLAQCQRGTFPPAWEFQPGGCNAGRWTASFNGGDCASPTGSFTASYAFYEEGAYPAASRIRIGAAFAQPVTLAADQAYHLVTLTFDHGVSVAGATASPDSCGLAGDPVCLYLDSALWLDGHGGSGSWNQFMPGLTWNRDSAYYYYGCPFLCDPAERATWGSLKARYR